MRYDKLGKQIQMKIVFNRNQYDCVFFRGPARFLQLFVKLARMSLHIKRHGMFVVGGDVFPPPTDVAIGSTWPKLAKLLPRRN